MFKFISNKIILQNIKMLKYAKIT